MKKIFKSVFGLTLVASVVAPITIMATNNEAINQSIQEIKEEEVTETDKEDVIIPEFDGISAGIWDDSFYHETFSDPIIIEAIYDSTKLIGYGSKDVIIQTSKGLANLKFSIRRFNPDSTSNNSDEVYNYFYINIPEAFDIISIKETFLVPKKSLDIYSAAVLNKNNPIKHESNWYLLNNVNHNIILWEEPAKYIEKIGEWYKLNSIAYIGFRENDKPGWLRIDMTNMYSPRIMEYAIKK